MIVEILSWKYKRNINLLGELELALHLNGAISTYGDGEFSFLIWFVFFEIVKELLVRYI